MKATDHTLKRELQRNGLRGALRRHRLTSERNAPNSRKEETLNPQAVSRHFQWMKQYGIDGAFVQRFAVRLRPLYADSAADWERVLDNCRRAAREHGRLWVKYSEPRKPFRLRTALLKPLLRWGGPSSLASLSPT